MQCFVRWCCIEFWQKLNQVQPIVKVALGSTLIPWCANAKALLKWFLNQSCCQSEHGFKLLRVLRGEPASWWLEVRLHYHVRGVLSKNPHWRTALMPALLSHFCLVSLVVQSFFRQLQHTGTNSPTWIVTQWQKKKTFKLLSHFNIGDTQRYRHLHTRTLSICHLFARGAQRFLEERVQCMHTNTHLHSHWPPTVLFNLSTTTKSCQVASKIDYSVGLERNIQH